ncbi:MAG: hypothetical protein M3151_14260 [Actinomycetota bacterium]|nr:hypothetical protein [Actinomycetota bacterium]
MNTRQATAGIPAGSWAAPKVAWFLCGLALALIACAVVLGVLNGADVDAVSFPLAMTVSAVVGGLIASRRPENPIGWFFLGGAVCFAFVTFASEYAAYGSLDAPGTLPGALAMAWLVSWVSVPGVMLLLIFVPLYFPNGRLVSPGWRWLVRLAVFFSVSEVVRSALSPGKMRDSGIVNPLGIEALRPVFDLFETLVFAVYFTLLFASAASLVVRFRRSGSVERQQIKWLALAALAIPVWFLTNAPIQAVAPNLFLVIDSLVVSALIPLAAGIAILRYRLYDIDVIINRALVYASLTVTLALVYVGSVVSLQAALRALTVQESTLAVVASTLAIAALFNPLRRGMQGFVDRRFYRRKYDAAKTLAALNARLRNETDLDALGDNMVGVVRETMQPEHVAVWLRSPERRADKGSKNTERTLS